MPSIGEFGSAETVGGPLRDLTAAEAGAVDPGGSYRQFYGHELFERALCELIARHSG